MTLPVAQDSALRSASATTLGTTSTHEVHMLPTGGQVGRVLVECWSSAWGALVRPGRAGNPVFCGGLMSWSSVWGGPWSSVGRVLVECAGVFVFLFLLIELRHSTGGQPPPMLCHACPAAGEHTPTALADRRHSIADQTVQTFQRQDTWSKQFALPGHS